MRKLLLASAAAIGVVGVAHAQTIVSAPVPNVPGANPAAQGSPSGGLSTPAGLTPGSIQVRLNGKFNWYAGFIADGDMNASYWANSATTPTGASWYAKVTGASWYGASNQTIFVRPGGYQYGGTLANVTSPVGVSGAPTGVAAKQNQGVSFASYIRLYPGFDGMAANGLRYGVSAEIRQDIGGSGAPGSVIGVSGGGAAGSISVQNQKRSYLYWRRAYGYVAGDNWGTLRFGSGDGPSTLFMTGNFENINDGGWNGDLPGMLTGAAPLWPFADVGSVYNTNKLVYLSPQFAGFDAGLSWAPTSNALSNSTGCIMGMASVGCDRLSSIDSTGNTKEQLRQHDFFEAFARYRGNFNGVGISAYGGWFGSTGVHMNDSLGSFTTYKNNSIGVGGAQISYAGVTVGGMVQGGDYNRGQGFNPAPTGTNASLAWLVGASYTTGPIIFGGSYFEATSPGSYVPASNVGYTPGVGTEQKERGLAIGGTYAVAPGFSLFLSYLWGDRHQDGVNLLTGETNCTTVATGGGGYGKSAGCFKNDITVQAISLGTQLRW